MTALPDRIPASIPAEPGVIGATAALLAHIEELPRHATGALRFGHEGLVLLESRQVCWAVAAGMSERLTELLAQQRNPPIERARIEECLRECRERGVPVGEALLAAGHVTERGLRTALFRQSTEAIAHIARTGTRSDAFVPHERARYDARFVFPTAEILAFLGARRHLALAAAARSELLGALGPDTAGLAFVRDEGESQPTVVSVIGAASLRVVDILDVCGWAAGVFDVATALDPELEISLSTWDGGVAVVSWRHGEAQLVALCPTRAASATLVARLSTPCQRERGGAP